MSDTNGHHHPPDLATAVALLAEVTAQTGRATGASTSGGEEWMTATQTMDLVASPAAMEEPPALDEPPSTDDPRDDDREAGDAEWYMRPWRERVQAADVAIAGLVVVIGLVVGLVFWLASPSTAPGSKPLAFPQLSGPSHTGTGTSTHNSGTGSSSGGNSASSNQKSTGSGNGAASSQAGGSATQPAGAGGTSPSHASSPPAGQAAATATPPQCTPGNLTVSTTTDSSNYSVGSPVTVTTNIVANTACVYDPVASGAYGCPTTVVIVNQVGAPVYPQPGQSEQCATVSGGTLNRGYGRSVTITWDQAPLGEYSAVGTWSFGDSANPDQVSASSQPFTVSL